MSSSSARCACTIQCQPVPTQVEYGDRHSTMCLGARKKRGDRTWHYFTGKRSTYYPIAAVGSMSASWSSRRKLSRVSLIPDGSEWLEVTVQGQRAEMVASQQEYGAGVKQSIVRSAYTKFKAGTLPLSVSYRATRETVQTDKPFMRTCNKLQSHQNPVVVWVRWLRS